mmetsp:Transcript_25910/g.97597  ORF Transcript_25910/g.97597 Transcript_25910/m.97597 type:complete len:216 (-) Transcript_25910:709-1356(-)
MPCWASKLSLTAAATSQRGKPVLASRRTKSSRPAAPAPSSHAMWRASASAARSWVARESRSGRNTRGGGNPACSITEGRRRCSRRTEWRRTSSALCCADMAPSARLWKMPRLRAARATAAWVTTASALWPPGRPKGSGASAAGVLEPALPRPREALPPMPDEADDAADPGLRDLAAAAAGAAPPPPPPPWAASAAATPSSAGAVRRVMASMRAIA